MMKCSMMVCLVFRLALLLIGFRKHGLVWGSENSATAPLTCSVEGDEEGLLDPALQEMTYDIGDGEQKFMAYMQPDVTTFYQNQDLPSKTAVVPKHNGLAGKFINMSKEPVRFYWEPAEGGTPSLMKYFPPFSSSGTATFPGHRFFFTPQDDPDTVLMRYRIMPYPTNVYIYDPYHVPDDPEQTEKNLSVMTAEERKKYDKLRNTHKFHKQYQKATGRSYLPNYLRKRPAHFMWPADYFGQEHWVTTRETHFVYMPPMEELNSINVFGKQRRLEDHQPRLLMDYRDPTKMVMNMTLRVLSCAPRVFQIDNFLSEVEVEHIMDIAHKIDLKLSTTGLAEPGETKVAKKSQGGTSKTRTSFNSWVPREKSPVIDAIYRRASDLLRIDEAFMRYRGDGEYPDLGTNKSIAEALQLVHYDITQEYTAHHDFGYPAVDNDFQSARFATLLLYLNEGMEGGETSFPRWVNAETFDQLKVAPEVGKAVLFYSQLPDGNFDDFSHHAALPVRSGEKWLINLWVWDPVYEK